MKQNHNNNHIKEKEQFRKLFKQEHVDNFEERFKVFEIFLQTERHVTVSELLKLLNENGYQLESSFVRDTLKLMCCFGFAKKIKFEDGPVRYEHRHLGQHHDHMICTKCRNIIEFENQQLENLQIRIAAAYGFHMLQHKMEIYGICSNCLKARLQPMSLVMARQGEHLIIKDFTGGAGARMRLLTMGLRVGDELDVITSPSKGQMVIAVDCRRYILGHGLAQKVLVEPRKN